jgi:hypothetical protein
LLLLSLLTVAVAVVVVGMHDGMKICLVGRNKDEKRNGEGEDEDDEGAVRSRQRQKEEKLFLKHVEGREGNGICEICTVKR